jgi:Ser/Thr protein kinase RdoA (MazF antagonist)
VIEHKGQCAALFPFIDGDRLDREDPRLRDDAARCLAAIHRATRSGFDIPRPPSRWERTSLPELPAALLDASLDTWWNSTQGRLTMAPIHGDYYRGNLLCRGRKLIGVIDWHDARVAPLALELAAATFELCKDTSQTLHVDRARAFVKAYLEADGPIPEREIELLPMLMRVWIREDVQRSLLQPNNPDGQAYRQQQIRAFQALKDIPQDLL